MLYWQKPFHIYGTHRTYGVHCRVLCSFFVVYYFGPEDTSTGLLRVLFLTILRTGIFIGRAIHQLSSVGLSTDKTD